MTKKWLALILSCAVLLSCIGVAPLFTAAQQTYDYEIIQDFSTAASYTRNSMWSRGVLTAAKSTLTGSTDGAATIFQMSETQVNNGENMVNGTAALAMRMTSQGFGWGASHLVNGNLPAATIQDMSGIFFRMKTDTTHKTALSVTTVGKNTVATGSSTATGSNPAKYLKDGDKNDHNTVGNAGALLDEYSLTKNSDNIRYYSTAGTLVATGRAVPAGFDGWIFIEVDNWDSYTKDGLTINWIDSDYDYVTTHVSEIGGANNKWCVNGTMTSVVIDDLGYYFVDTADADGDYQAILNAIANPQADPYFAYQVIQDFSTADNYTRNSMWSRGVLTAAKSNFAGSTDGAATIYQLSEAQVNNGDHMVNGTPALALRMASQGFGWGATHLMNGNLPAATIQDMSGIFFRMKTDTKHKTALSVTTVGKNTVATGSNTATGSNPAKYLKDGDKNDHNTVGNAGALLDEYSLTKNSSNIRYYSTAGALVATGRAIPAGFDGYVFIEVANWDSYTKDGLTINWIDSDYDYVTTYVPEIGGANNKWCLNDGTLTSVVIDDLGYFAAGSPKMDDNYRSIIDALENPGSGGEGGSGEGGSGEGGSGEGGSGEGGSGEGGSGEGDNDEKKYSYNIIQNYETQADRDNSDRALILNGTSSFGEVTNSATSAPSPLPAALNGEHSFFSVLSDKWGVDHLVSALGSAPDSGITGLFLRMNYDLTEKMAGKKLILSINTTGSATTEHQEKGGVEKDVPITGMGKAQYDLTNGNSGIRYYNVDGTVNTEASANLMPAAFDGYIFIPVANVSAYTWDGISIVYAPNWAVSGATGHWQLPGKVVGFDDIGFYTMADDATDSDYTAIISEVGGKSDEDDGEKKYATNIIQNYETQADRDNSDRALILGGTSSFGTVTTPATYAPNPAPAALNGSHSFFSVLTGNWGVDHLVAALDGAPDSSITGVMLRMSYDLTDKMAGKKLVLSINTTGSATTEHQEKDGVEKDVPITGMGKAQYDLTNGNSGIRYFNADGTVNTEAAPT